MSNSRHRPPEQRWYSSLALEDCTISREQTTGFLHLCWNALWQNNPVTAVQLPTEDESEVQRVVEQLKSLRHPNVLQFWGVVDSVEVGVPIITEHLQEDLSQLLERLPDLHFSTRVNGLKQVANALSYLHSRGICHGNLTPQSIFATDEGRVIKLAYFGRARFSQKAAAAFPDDIDSYGSIIQIMLCGYENEFKFQEAMKNYQKVNKGGAKELTSLHKKCKEKLSKRPDAREVARLAAAIKTESEESKIQKKDDSNASAQADYKSKLDDINASKKKNDAETAILHEKAKTLEKIQKERESLLAENKKLQADLQKVKDETRKDRDTLTKQLETEKKSWEQKQKTVEEENKTLVLQQRKTLEEKRAAVKKCGEMENLAEQMKVYNQHQGDALTEAKNDLGSSRKIIAAKDTAFQQQKELLEETTNRLKRASDYVSRIQSSSSDILPKIQVPVSKQPSHAEDLDEIGNLYCNVSIMPCQFTSYSSRQKQHRKKAASR